MATSPKERLRTFLDAEPGTASWPEAALELERVFGRLDVEDQVETVARLAAAGEAGADSLTRLDARGEASLPARVALREALTRLGRPMDDEVTRLLRGWLGLCEGGADCEPGEFFTLPAAERAAVVDHLARWLRSDLLARLAEAAPDKNAAKEVKKALHRARSAGAAAAEAAGTVFVQPSERREYLDEAYLSPPDAFGATFIYLYRTVFGRHTLFIAAVSDTDGVVKFDAFEVPEAKFRKVIESARRDPVLPLERADAGYVRRLIRAAEENGRRAGRSMPPEYLRNRRALGIADEPERPHPVLQRFPVDELRQDAGAAARSAELAGHRIFRSWALAPLDQQQFVLKFQEMKLSPLALSPAQAREREDRLLEEEATRSIEAVGRGVWLDRLLQCAYLLDLAGEEATARLCAATALEVEGGRTPALFVELMRRAAARLAGEEVRNQEPGGSVIL